MNGLLLLPFLVLAVLLGVLGFVLKYRHSEFPDCRVGYHHKRLMENREAWDYGNRMAGTFCMIFAVILALLCVLLDCLQVRHVVAFLILFTGSLLAVIGILALPILLLKKNK